LIYLDKFKFLPFCGRNPNTPVKNKYRFLNVISAAAFLKIF